MFQHHLKYEYITYPNITGSVYCLDQIYVQKTLNNMEQTVLSSYQGMSVRNDPITDEWLISSS